MRKNTKFNDVKHPIFDVRFDLTPTSDGGDEYVEEYVREAVNDGNLGDADVLIYRLNNRIEGDRRNGSID